MPKLRCVRSLTSRPFCWPTSATVRPSSGRGRPRSRGRRRGRGRRAARPSPRAGARRSRACTAGPRGGRARPSARSPRRSARPRPARAGAAAARARPRGGRRQQGRLPSARAARAAGARASVAICRRVGAGARAYGRSSGRGTIASRWPKRRFGSARPKSSGSFSRVVCWTTRGPANDISAPGSATRTSPRLAKLASTPPVVGCARTRDQRAAGVVQILDRGDRLRQLHQREDPLLHARAARGGDRDERDAALRGALARARELLADGAAPSSRP